MHQSNLTSSFAGLHRLNLVRLTLALAASLGFQATHAATRTWTGGHASSANWNLRDNWGGVAVPASGDTLVFPDGAARLINTNNIAGLRLNRIQFSGAVGGYNLRSLGLVVSNGITALGAANNTVGLDNLTLERSQSFNVVLGGGLTVNSDLALNGFNLAIAAVGEVTMTGVISGTGNVSKTGAGTLRFSSANTYQGVTTVTEGTLRIGNDAALGAAKNGTVVTGGAELVLDAAIGVLREPLTLAGAGPGGSSGALRLGSSATIATNIVLSAPATIHTMAGGNLTIAGVISGSGSLTKVGPGTLLLAGSSANTFIGDLLVKEGLLLLGKSAGNAIPGQLILGVNGTPAGGTTAIARYTQPSQIFGTVTVNAGSLFDLNGHNEAISDLILNGGADVETGAGELQVTHSVTANAGPVLNGSTSTIDGQLNFGVGAGTRHIIVAETGGLFGDGADLVINARIRGSAPLLKQGSGDLGLTASNSFSGTLTVEDGELNLSHGHALGAAFGGVTLLGDSVLNLAGNIAIFDEELTVDSQSNNGALRNRSGTNVWVNQVHLTQDAVIHAATNTALVLSGRLDGPGGLTKIGPGLLAYSGIVSNTYLGATRVNEGRLRLDRTGGDNYSIPGTLIIGDGLGGPEADVVELLGPDPQIHNLAAVIVNSSGLLRHNLFNPAEGIGSLAGNGRVHIVSPGWHIRTGENGDSTVFDGVISGAGWLSKIGPGTFTLNGSNTYAGGTVVGEGTLVVNGHQPQSEVSVMADATLSGVGMVGNVEVSGTLAPGNHLGMLMASGVDFAPGSRYAVELNGASSNTGYDSLYTTGSVDVAGSTLDVSLGFAPFAGQKFVVMYKSSLAGTFAGLPEGAEFVANQIPLSLSYVEPYGYGVQLTVGDLALRLASTRVEAGNGNGLIEPNECNDFFVAVENPTGSAVQILSAYLESLDNHIAVTQAKGEYGNVPAFGVRTNRTAFQIRSSLNYPCGRKAQFHLVINTAAHGQFAIPIALPTGSPGAFVTSAGPDGPQLIPPVGTLISHCVVTNDFRIGKLRVSLHASHPSAGDLRFRLRGPLGHEALLAANRGGNAANYGLNCARRTTFDDDAPTKIATAAAPFFGTFAPEEKLFEFVGTPAAGNWTLTVEDTVAGNLGALQCWSLDLAPAECTDGGGGCESCLASVNGALNHVSRTMPHSLNASAWETGCGNADPCPGPSYFGEAPFRYATHRFTNNGPDTCVTVVLNVPCGETNSALLCSAYRDDFDPTDLCLNFLGYCGFSIKGGSGGYSFRVPAGQRFTVVVNEVNYYGPLEGCDDYRLDLYGLPCPQGAPTLFIADDAGPDRVRLHWSTAYPGFQLQGTPSLGGVASFAFTNVAIMPVVIDGNYSVTNQHSQKNNGFFRLRRP